MQPTTATPITEHPELAERIEAMTPRLRKLALSMARDVFQADDLYQNAVVRILATCKPEHSDQIIYLRAKSAMLHGVRAEGIYNTYVSDENVVIMPATTPDGGDDDQRDGFAGNGLSPEEEAIENENRSHLGNAIRGLSMENQRVIGMLATGKSQAEIARELGVSRAAVSIRVSRIAARLRCMGVSQMSLSRV